MHIPPLHRASQRTFAGGGGNGAQTLAQGDVDAAQGDLGQVRCNLHGLVGTANGLRKVALRHIAHARPHTSQRQADQNTQRNCKLHWGLGLSQPCCVGGLLVGLLSAKQGGGSPTFPNAEPSLCLLVTYMHLFVFIQVA